MLHRVAVGLFAVSSVAAHVTALPFPEMRIPTASLLVLAALLIVGQLRSWSTRFASGAAQIAAARPRVEGSDRVRHARIRMG